MTSPRFSVLLPTYNRATFLTSTIKSILKQDLEDFELLILDDASTDNTSEIVKLFSDKRISYIRHKKNLGVAANAKYGFLKAKGKYIFTLGDDDLILYPYTFSRIYKIMEKYQAGFGHMPHLNFEHDPRKPSSYVQFEKEVKFFPPTEDILIKTMEWRFGFISGNVFRGDILNEEDILENNIWWIYFKSVYRAMLTHGCVYLSDIYILARISSTGNISYVDVEHNKEFYVNRLLEIYKEFDHSKERFERFKKYRLDFVLMTLPGIKYYTSNKNIGLMTRAILKLRPAYLYEPFFWYSLFITYIIPKQILSILRWVRIKIGEYRLKKVVEYLQVKKYI